MKKIAAMYSFKDLQVYQKAFQLAIEIFKISGTFPKEEKYSLTDQIRRCSRSVCANFAEAYRRRRYPSYFISRLSDADALALGYITPDDHTRLVSLKIEIGKLLGDVIKNPAKYK